MKTLLALLASLAIAVTVTTVSPALASDEGPDDYLVILGAFPLTNSGSLSADRRLARVHQCGLTQAYIVSTNDYPNLSNGLYAVVLGTYTEGLANDTLYQARGCISDAYVKSGW